MNRCFKWVVRTLHLPALLGLAAVSFAQAPVAWGGDAHIPSLNTLRKIDRVSVGVNHVLAVSNDGHVLQLGTLQGSPVPAGLINPRSIAAGNDFSLAVTSAGSIVGWGGSANNPGRTMIPSGSGFLQVRAGDRRGAAIRSDGSFVLWGKSQFGETDVPQDVRRVRQLAIGADFMAAITPGGQLRAWGRVIGDTNGNITSTVPAGSDFVDVKASPDGHHAVALRADGTVAAWGLNSDGQTTVPERLSNPLHPQFRRVRSIAAGTRHSSALLQNGFTIRWGAKDLGQTANPPTAATFEQVFAGGNTNVGITAKPVARWSFDQATVVGGSVKTVCATLTLNEPAADPLTIRLESEDPQCVSVPTVVSIPKGASSGTFQLTHRVVGDLKTVPMNASGDIAPARGSIRVTPNWSTALSATASTVLAGTPVRATVDLTDVMRSEATVVTLSGSPELVLPRLLEVPAGSQSASFEVSMAAGTPAGTYEFTATTVGRSRTRTLIVAAVPLITSFSVPTTLTGNSVVMGRVTIGSRSPVETVVALASSNSSVSLPGSVTIPAGALTATFSISVQDVRSPIEDVVLSASSANSSHNVVTTVRPNGVNGLVLDTTSASLGQGFVTATVTLRERVATDTSVTITSSYPGSVPESITIPAGAKSGTFVVRITPVQVGKMNRIYATLNDLTKIAYLSVNP